MKNFVVAGALAAMLIASPAFAQVAPAEPEVPTFPTVIQQVEQPYQLPPVPDQGPTVSPIDPVDVQPLREAEPTYPAPIDDGPTLEEIRELTPEAVPGVAQTADPIDEDPAA